MAIAALLGVAGGVAPAEGEVLRLVDSAGRVVELPQSLERVVVLSPPAAEILLALGVPEVVVATSASVAQMPEYAAYAGLPQVAPGAHQEPDLEKIVALAPQAVITYGTHPAVDVEELSRLLAPAAVPVVGIDAWRLDTLYRDIFLLGLMFGRLERAAELITFFNSAWGEAQAAIPAGLPGPRVYAEHHGGRAYGPGSEWDRLIQLAGGKNVFADAHAPYVEVDPEVLLERDPDVILIDVRTSPRLGYGVSEVEEASSYLAGIKARPGWGLLSAVQTGKVFLISPSLGAGPRKLFLLPYLVKILHPEAAVDPEAWLRRYHEEWLGVPHMGVFVWPEP